MHVDKRNKVRLTLCVTCKHEECAQDVPPCNMCWNPMGDMYVDKTEPPPKKSRTFVTCEHCKGAGEIEAANVELSGAASSRPTRTAG